MVSINLTAGLTMNELCEEVAQKLNAYHLGKQDDGFGPRTVRFYIASHLLAPVGKGPGKKYDADTVWKILFIRHVQDRYGLSLEALRPVMAEVPVDTMRRVVTGEEPLELASADDSDAIGRHRAKGMQVVRLGATEGQVDPTDSKGGGSWQILTRTDVFEIRARRGTSPATLRQLRQLAALATSITEEKPSRLEDPDDESTPNKRSEPMIVRSPDPRRDRASDAPERLALLTDLAKAEAVARALGAAAGQAFSAMVDAVRYTAFPRCPEFHRPVEIRVSVSTLKDAGAAVLQSHTDASFEDAIAKELGKAAGEPYRVRIIERNYARAFAPDGGVRLTFQVGKA